MRGGCIPGILHTCVHKMCTHVRWRARRRRRRVYTSVASGSHTCSYCCTAEDSGPKQKSNGCRSAGERYCNGRAKKHTDAGRENHKSRWTRNILGNDRFRCTCMSFEQAKKIYFTECVPSPVDLIKKTRCGHVIFQSRFRVFPVLASGVDVFNEGSRDEGLGEERAKLLWIQIARANCSLRSRWIVLCVMIFEKFSEIIVSSEWTYFSYRVK